MMKVAIVVILLVIASLYVVQGQINAVPAYHLTDVVNV